MVLKKVEPPKPKEVPKPVKPVEKPAPVVVDVKVFHDYSFDEAEESAFQEVLRVAEAGFPKPSIKAFVERHKH